MIRIAHSVPSVGWGGAEELATTLHHLGLQHGWGSTMDIPCHKGPMGPGAWLRWAMRARPEADLVHAHLPWPDRLGAALVSARGRPLVVTFHLLPEAKGWPRDRILGVPSPWLFSLSGRLRRRVSWVALSECDRTILSGLLGARVRLVRNAPPAPRPVADPVRWPGAGLRLLSVGRLSWQKGFDQMLDALGAPVLRDLSWCWCVIGEGDDRAALEARTMRLGLTERVRFLGARPASEGLLHADLVLAPSRREGMPLVPLESAEAGVAVLASDISAHRELYASAPEGLLPLDTSRWPEHIARYLRSSELREKLALAQRAIVGNTPREAMWTAYQAVYEATLSVSS